MFQKKNDSNYLHRYKQKKMNNALLYIKKHFYE